MATTAQQTSTKQVYVPLQFSPGEAFQFDWSEDWIRINGVSTKLQIAHVMLSYSRAFFMRAYLTQTHEMLFDAHYHAFAAFGGIPERGVMMPVPAAFDGFIEHSKRVSSTCLIIFEHNRYSVPASFANQVISLRIYPQHLVIVAEAQVVAEHERVFSRDKQGPGVTVYDWRHYLAVIQRKPGALRNGAPFTELPDSFKQLQARLLKRLGGDREMVDILALVLLHDERLVEQAIIQALAAGESSREHVVNCLSRLEQPPRPQPLTPPSALQLVTEPQANTARYDDLRRLCHDS